LVTKHVFWEIDYLDGDTLRNIKDFVGYFEDPEVNDELNSEAIATFVIPNSENSRSLVSYDYGIAMFCNGNLVFSGLLKAADIGPKKIKCYVHDQVICALDEAEPITGLYDAVSAQLILDDVVDGLDIDWGDCPTTDVTVVFYKANRLDVVKFLADDLGLDYYSTGDEHINIGFRNANNWTLRSSDFTVSKRGLDRTKYARKVIIRGVDLFGRHITGEAGSGTPVRTFNADTPANQDALVNLAAKKLAELGTDSAGAPISTRIDVGSGFQVGDYVELFSGRYMLGGSRRIMQISKTKTKVSMQLDYIRKSIDKTVADLRSWEKKGIYLPGCTSWSINLQNLVGLYHLTEGTGTVAKDSSPVETPADGTIVNGHWDPSPIGGGAKVLALQGDGYVDCGTGINLDSNDSCFSVGGWFSPVDLDNTNRFLAHKDGQFALSYVNTVLRFTFTDTSNGVGYCDSDAGKVKAYGRHFVMITFNGSVLTMYLNAQVHKTWTLNIVIHASTNKVYLGMFLKGNAAEMMFWTRCLTCQEVAELYFFPLTRCV
jgi:hypothetical protein